MQALSFWTTASTERVDGGRRLLGRQGIEQLSAKLKVARRRGISIALALRAKGGVLSSVRLPGGVGWQSGKALVKIMKRLHVVGAARCLGRQGQGVPGGERFLVLAMTANSTGNGNPADSFIFEWHGN